MEAEMHHSELYRFASSYWWLIFPLGWGMVAMLQTWTQHRRAQATLDLLKSYVDQGKEPPAALLETILPQAATPGWTYQPLHFWLSALLLGAGAVGFAALTWLRSQQGDPDSANALFIAILLGAGAAACAVFAMVVQARKPGAGAS
jgi:hypothetical protein